MFQLCVHAPQLKSATTLQVSDIYGFSTHQVCARDPPILGYILELKEQTFQSNNDDGCQNTLQQCDTVSAGDQRTECCGLKKKEANVKLKCLSLPAVRIRLEKELGESSVGKLKRTALVQQTCDPDPFPP